MSRIDRKRIEVEREANLFAYCLLSLTTDSISGKVAQVIG